MAVRLAVATATLAVPWSAAQAKVRAVIVQWGETQLETSGVPDPADQAGLLAPGIMFRSRRFVNHDDHVPAQRCRAFGIDAWLTHGPGEVLPERILMRIRHPLLTRPDGVSATQQSVMAHVINGSIEDSYSLDEPWEVQSGEWSFDLIVDDEVIASKTFTVTPREPGSPASICESGPVS